MACCSIRMSSIHRLFFFMKNTIKDVWFLNSKYIPLIPGLFSTSSFTLPQSQTGLTATGRLYVDYLLLAKFSLGEGLNR